MSICTFCKKEMSDRVSCESMLVLIGDAAYEPVKNDEKSCGWCLCPPGGYHHPGCAMERCPKCGEQKTSCDCFLSRPRIVVLVKGGVVQDVLADQPCHVQVVNFDDECHPHPSDTHVDGSIASVVAYNFGNSHVTPLDDFALYWVPENRIGDAFEDRRDE